MTWRSTMTYAGLQNFVVYRISATLQLLFFFFCAVFLLPPRHFYIKNGIHALDTVSSIRFAANLQSCLNTALLAKLTLSELKSIHILLSQANPAAPCADLVRPFARRQPPRHDLRAGVPRRPAAPLARLPRRTRRRCQRSPPRPLPGPGAQRSLRRLSITPLRRTDFRYSTRLPTSC